MLKKKAERAPFYASLGVSLAILITGLGFATVDYQGRRLSLGDSTPPVDVVSLPNGGTGVHIKLMGIDRDFDITGFKAVWDFVCDFACLPRDSAR